jgi:hypothetical protein
LIALTEIRACVIGPPQRSLILLLVRVAMRCLNHYGWRIVGPLKKHPSRSK